MKLRVRAISWRSTKLWCTVSVNIMQIDPTYPWLPPLILPVHTAFI